jgi:hypothetical protein
MAHAAPPNSLTYTPDYAALIANDPAFQALSNRVSATDQSNAAQRAAQTAQSLIQFGDVPDFTSLASSLGLSPEAVAMLQHDIDPNAAALAHANTAAGLSTEGRLQQQQNQAITSLRNALAAHGALGSGDNAYRTGLQDQAYTKAQSDALNALLQAISGYQSNYLAAHQAGLDSLDAGRQTAQAFEATLPSGQGFVLHYNVKGGYYTDASGNKYMPHRNADGTWTLKNSATGAVYTLGTDGKLTYGDSGSHTPHDPPGWHGPKPPPGGGHDPGGYPPPGWHGPNPPPGGGHDPGGNPPPGWHGPTPPPGGGHNPDVPPSLPTSPINPPQFPAPQPPGTPVNLLKPAL